MRVTETWNSSPELISRIHSLPSGEGNIQKHLEGSAPTRGSENHAGVLIQKKKITKLWNGMNYTIIYYSFTNSYGRLVWGLLPFLQVNLPRSTWVESYQQGQSDPLRVTRVLAMSFTWHSYIAPVSIFRYTLCLSQRCFSFILSFGILPYSSLEG